MKVSHKVSLFLLSLLSVTSYANVLSDWHGVWQGECHYQAPGTLDVEVIPMTIEIAPVSSNEVSWNMHYYRSSGDIVKNYLLRGVDLATGHYVMDEQNGILIDEFLRQNQLMAHFEVNKRRITTSAKLLGNRLDYTALAFGSDLERRNKGAGVLVFGDPALEACELYR